MAQERKNRDFNPHNCGVTHFLNKIGGRWKVLVIHGIRLGCNRLSALQKAIPQVSKQLLVNLLRELEADGLIERIVYAEVPPKVEYRLTAYGNSLLPVIQIIQDWGIVDMQRVGGINP